MSKKIFIFLIIGFLIYLLDIALNLSKAEKDIYIADDEIKTPGHNDQRFVGKIDRIHKKNPNYVDVSHSLKGKSSFSIKHYAGPVSYDATGFLAKNKDLLRKDLYNLISTEGLEQTKELFPMIDTSSRKNIH